MISSTATPLRKGNAKMTDADHKLTATEALYGFMGWLTSRKTEVTLSGHHDAAVAAELVAEFVKANGLGDVSREDWNKFLTHPSDPS
jgi:hypothetical protein